MDCLFIDENDNPAPIFDDFENEKKSYSEQVYIFALKQLLIMKEQNFKNHSRMVPGYHYVTGLAIFALIGGSINYLLKSTPENKYLAALLVLTSLILFMLYAYTRIFPLKAQDRAIRAEENLRYYALAGKLFPNTLSISQIIALRFAPDEELLALVDRAATESLSAKEIKQAIKNWKADYYRV